MKCAIIPTQSKENVFMKLKIEILEDYKSYKKDTFYELEGDLILLSGINGSGKSQLLNIIANSTTEKIARNIYQNVSSGAEIKNSNNIMLLSFRDNINIERNFGEYSVSLKQSNLEIAWNFYKSKILCDSQYAHVNNTKKEKFKNNKLILTDDGTKNPSWRSINQIIDLLKLHYTEEKLFHLTHDEFKDIIPLNFIWRNENDIINQIGNIFYIACCDRADEQIECSKTTKIFNNTEWLKTAPWTILNTLFEKLGFKYRFKEDYVFHTPNLDENPRLRIKNDIRLLSDLSDGEKAILKLALISLDQQISNDLKVVLFDEYDAPLNPSLTDAFYHVIEEFYIKKGIQVIITTHSPATISLAPSYTKFYEIFNQENSSPKIIQVNQFDYAELKEANKTFYDKIKNQEERICILEKNLQQTGNALLVEDEYYQIYKIAYLKLKGINDLNENNLDKKFSENANFSINGNYATGGLYNYLNCQNTTLDNTCKRICLFDFDQAGYHAFKKVKDLKIQSQKIYDVISENISSGIYLKHKNCDRYALMIPIPNRLLKFVSQKSSSDCFIEIESLLSEDYLKTNKKAEIRSEALPFYKLKDKHKKDLWKDLLTANKDIFKDFKPLFATVESLFD